MSVGGTGTERYNPLRRFFQRLENHGSLGEVDAVVGQLKGFGSSGSRNSGAGRRTCGHRAGRDLPQTGRRRARLATGTCGCRLHRRVHRTQVRRPSVFAVFMPNRSVQAMTSPFALHLYRRQTSPTMARTVYQEVWQRLHYQTFFS